LEPSQPNTDRARGFLAVGITMSSVLAVVVLGYVSITKNETKAEQVLATALPLLGTWVGTVLAYYFARENFESASRSVSAMARQLTTSDKLAAISVKAKMIINDPQALFAKSEPFSSVSLKALLDELDAAKKGLRIPLLDAGRKHIRYVVHRSMIERFLSTQALQGKAQQDLLKLSLDDILRDPTLKLVAESFVVVDESDTLALAKRLMDSKPNCQDAFVTRGGKDTDELVGWVTNVIIEENSKV
jgi:hypothetical protein